MIYLKYAGLWYGIPLVFYHSLRRWKIDGRNSHVSLLNGTWRVCCSSCFPAHSCRDNVRPLDYRLVLARSAEPGEGKVHSTINMFVIIMTKTHNKLVTLYGSLINVMNGARFSTLTVTVACDPIIFIPNCIHWT